jgi:V8-like Glu-specific endopeptidase
MGRVALRTFFGALFALRFCGALASAEAQAQLLPPFFGNIFRPDDRFEVLPRSDLYQAIVRTAYRNPQGQNAHCTATLIGPRLLLTVAHCVLEVLPAAGNVPSQRMRVVALEEDLWVIAESRVTRVVALGGRGPFDREFDRANDWAILEIADPLGDTFGTLPVSDEVRPGRADVGLSDIRFAGYSADFHQGYRMSGHALCSIRRYGVGDYLMRHDCDSTRGASGAPLIRCSGDRGCRIVGIHAAEYRADQQASLQRDTYHDDYANLAIPASEFIEDVNRALHLAD